MPGRRGRSGGRRSGAPGKAYGNRSDLNGAQPMKAAPGQAYGKAKEQLDAQRVAPMGTPEVTRPEPAMPNIAGSGLAAAGSMGDLFADSENPDENVMNGAALGPGAGPEAFGLSGPDATDLSWFKDNLPALESAANGPNGSDRSRQVIRTIKAQLNLSGLV